MLSKLIPLKAIIDRIHPGLPPQYVHSSNKQQSFWEGAKVRRG
jgi:hypothetical protein